VVLLKPRLNQANGPRFGGCEGLRMVAHKAGVRMSAVSTESPIAETMVIENCR
jgi:hypothetical protein